MKCLICGSNNHNYDGELEYCDSKNLAVIANALVTISKILSEEYWNKQK